MLRSLKDDIDYLLTTVEAHVDKFPVPEHMRSLVTRVRNGTTRLFHERDIARDNLSRLQHPDNTGQ